VGGRPVIALVAAGIAVGWVAVLAVFWLLSRPVVAFAEWMAGR